MPDSTLINRTLSAQAMGAQASSRSVEDDVKAAADAMDRAFRANIARATLGLSLSTLGGAYLDWTTHLLAAPGKQAWLGWKAWRKALRYGNYLGHCATHKGHAPPCIAPLPGDHRFDDAAWQNWPYNAYYQSFLLWQQWLHNATVDVPGVSAAHERVISFVARQILDIVAPPNFPWTNPVVLRQAAAESGANFLRGLSHFCEDIGRAAGRGSHGANGANPAVGESVAITPGKVVFRNRLIELLQYAPATQLVRPEPVLIVPAWIMKYYILDLSPENSLVRYLVDQGFTVFMISWRNPDADDRDLGMEDYLCLGVHAAIKAALAITGRSRLHAAGYCLGGTLLSIAAAEMARDGDQLLVSMSLFAAQQDFTDAGELTLFISESQVALLEDMMWEQGFLDARQMAGAFQILRSNDLVWSRVVQDYLLGERERPTGLMAWNADTTRMPARMHGEYLRHLFLDNDLAEGRFRMAGAPVALNDIRVPIFAVGTETDHVAPWRSAHKIHLLTDAQITFVLTSGGHNAGIVSEPGHPNRAFRRMVRPMEGLYVAPDQWLEEAEKINGSWWPAWTQWLSEHSGPPEPVPPLGNAALGYEAIGDAPGTYVHAA